jgi:hypothetical protein
MVSKEQLLDHNQKSIGKAMSRQRSAVVNLVKKTEAIHRSFHELACLWVSQHRPDRHSVVFGCVLEDVIRSNMKKGVWPHTPHLRSSYDELSLKKQCVWVRALASLVSSYR